MPPTDTLRRVSLAVLAALALLTGAKLAATFLAPVVFALVVGVVLSPLYRLWDRLGLPAVAAAVMSLAFGLLMIAALILAFQPVVVEILRMMPKVWSDVRDTIDTLRSAASGLVQTMDDVKEALEPAAQGGDAGERVQTTEESALPSMQDALVLAPAIMAQTFLFAGTLFFFALSRRETYAYISSALHGPNAQTHDRLLMAERKVSHYLLTISIINACLGLAVGAVMYWIGIPKPIYWGVAAAAMNYVLYLGPACIAAGLLISGIAAFNGAMSLAPPLAYLLLNALEAQFITPSFVGRNMRINPLLVFLSLTFGLWLWGPVGGVIAIPLLVWTVELTRPEARSEGRSEAGNEARSAPGDTATASAARGGGAPPGTASQAPR